MLEAEEVGEEGVEVECHWSLGKLAKREGPAMGTTRGAAKARVEIRRLEEPAAADRTGRTKEAMVMVSVGGSLIYTSFWLMGAIFQKYLVPFATPQRMTVFSRAADMSRSTLDIPTRTRSGQILATTHIKRNTYQHQRTDCDRIESFTLYRTSLDPRGKL